MVAITSLALLTMLAYASAAPVPAALTTGDLVAPAMPIPVYTRRALLSLDIGGGHRYGDYVSAPAPDADIPAPAVAPAPAPAPAPVPNSPAAPVPASQAVSMSPPPSKAAGADAGLIFDPNQIKANAAVKTAVMHKNKHSANKKAKGKTSKTIRKPTVQLKAARPAKVQAVKQLEPATSVDEVPAAPATTAYYTEGDHGSLLDVEIL